MTHLRFISAMLLVLGFTGLLLTGAIDWNDLRFDPRETWRAMCLMLVGLGVIGLLNKWRIR